MNTEKALLSEKEIFAIKMTAAALQIVAHHEVVRSQKGRDGVDIHCQWSAYGTGKHWFEVRKSGILLTKTTDPTEAAEKFHEAVSA